MPIDDDWSGVFSPIFGPATRAATVVPNDSTDLSHICSALYVGVMGDVALITFNFETVTFVAASGLLPIRARRVLASGTTASGILALS
jgi:membrane protein implicated in regulation of membrane protease activity